MWFTSPSWGNWVYLAGESAALNVLPEQIELFARKHEFSLSPFFLNWSPSWAWARLPSWVGTTEESTHYSHITSISTWSLKWHLFLLQSLITVVFLLSWTNILLFWLRSLFFISGLMKTQRTAWVVTVRVVWTGVMASVFSVTASHDLCVGTNTIIFHLPFSSVSSLKKKKPDGARQLQNQVVTFSQLYLM